MGVSFTDDIDPLLVETVADQDDDGMEFEEDADSLAESEISMSEFDGTTSALPRWCLFGPKECRCIFTMNSDKGVFTRVCGNAVAACTTRHTGIGERAKTGYYEPVKARKYVDGKFHTFLSMEEYAAMEQKRKKDKIIELQCASTFFQNLEGSPTGSEEAGYAQVKSESDGARLFNTDVGMDEKPTMAGPYDGMNLKNPPKYSDVKEETFLATPRPLKNPIPESVEPLMASPTLKTLQGQGMASDGMPALTVAMMGMMDELAKSVSALAGKVEQMESGKATYRETPKEAPPMVEPRASKEPTARKTREWYAVGFGRENRSGVFSTWAEAAPLVVGVSGAIHAKCRSWEEAQTFVEDTQALLKSKRAGTPEGLADSNVWYAVVNNKTDRTGIYPTWGEASVHVTGVSGANAKKFRSYQEAKIFTAGHEEARAEIRREQQPILSPVPEMYGSTAREHRGMSMEGEVTHDRLKDGYYPPKELIGADPSTKKEDEVFGVDTAEGETELRDALCPPGLSETLAKGLVNATIDVVSMPGGFFGGGDSETASSEMGVLGEAMAELVNQKRGTHDSSGRVDLHWRSEKRTAIRSLKNVTELRKRIKVLLKLRNKVLKRMHSVTINACKRAGWVDAIRMEAWASNGYLPRIVASTMEYYVSLHQHLMEMATSQNDSWDFVKVELDHHVDELELIRSTADSRLQAICTLYAYLRDGHQSGWYSSSLQSKRNMELFGKVTSPGSSVSTNSLYSNDGDAGPSCCIKCGTCLHLGGSSNCPWSNLVDAQAKKMGAKALRGLSQGTQRKGKGNKSDDADD
jgi:viroplasmin and RNaseH domain-containing protein